MFRAEPGAAVPILLESLAAGSGPRPWRSLTVVTEDHCGAVPVFPLISNRPVMTPRIG